MQGLFEHVYGMQLPLGHDGGKAKTSVRFSLRQKVWTGLGIVKQKIYSDRD